MRRALRPACAVAVLGALLAGSACERPEERAVPGPDSAIAPDSVPGPVLDTGAADTTPTSAPYRATGWDTVFVYFTDSTESRVPAPRPVPDTVDGLRAAFEALLRGPGPAEPALLSWFSPETAGMLREVDVTDGFAVLDFADFRPAMPNATASAGALMLLGELTATAFQFPGIRRVEFRIEGSCEALMAWLQFGCYPIRRADWDPPASFREAVRSPG